MPDQAFSASDLGITPPAHSADELGIKSNNAFSASDLGISSPDNSNQGGMNIPISEMAVSHQQNLLPDAQPMAAHAQTPPPAPPGRFEKGVHTLLGSDETGGWIAPDVKAIASNLAGGMDQAIAGAAGFFAKRMQELKAGLGPSVPVLDLARLVGKSISPKLDSYAAAQKILEHTENYEKGLAQQARGWAPEGYKPGLMGNVTRMAAPMSIAAANPAAGALLFGTSTSNEAQEAAKAAGATPAQQALMGLGGAIGGGIQGAFGAGTGSVAEHVAPNIMERLASMGQSYTIGGSVTAAMNALEKVVYNPNKKIMEGVNENALALGLVGFAHANGHPITEDEATSLAQFAKDNPAAFAKQYGDFFKSAEAPKPEETPQQTDVKALPEQLEQQRLLPKSKRNPELIASLREQIRAANAPALKPLEGTKELGYDERVPQEMQSTGGIAKTSRLQDLQTSIDANQKQLDIALNTADRTGSRKAKAEVKRLTGLVTDLRGQLSDLQKPTPVGMEQAAPPEPQGNEQSTPTKTPETPVAVPEEAVAPSAPEPPTTAPEAEPVEPINQG